MKIAILSDDFPPLSFGGAGIIAMSHVKELSRRGHDVIVITTVQDQNIEGKIIEDGVIIHRIFTNYPVRWRDYVSIYNREAIQKIKPILEVFRPDVVHLHNIHVHLSYYSFTLARRYSKAVFSTQHDSMSVHPGKIRPKIFIDEEGKRVFDYKVSFLKTYREYGLRFNPLRKIFIKYFLNKADQIYSVSDALREALFQNGIKNVLTMHNGIDSESFIASLNAVNEFKKKYSLQQKKVILFGGRISRLKGGDVALSIILGLSKQIPLLRLLIIGSGGQYMKELEEKVASLGFQHVVKFIPWLSREEIPSAYYASDIILVPSLYLDPFPTVNLESMAAKKPVIGTCYGGTPEAIKDGINGFIVDPDNIESVIDRVKILLEDEPKSLIMGEAGYKILKEEFNLFNQVDRLEKEYNTYAR